MFTTNTTSTTGSAPRFHSCAAANSKNVEYALLLLLQIPVGDVGQEKEKQTVGLGQSVKRCLHFSAEPFKQKGCHDCPEGVITPAGGLRCNYPMGFG